MDRSFRVNGTELFVSRHGPADAPAVVLLNSMAADTSMWAPQVHGLSRQFHVVCMDWRGHGRSREEPGPYTLDMLCDDVLGVVTTLGLERPHLAGTSLGGMVGMLLAISGRAPLASLTVCSALPRVAPGMAHAWSELAVKVRAEGIQHAVEGTLARWFTPEYRKTNPFVVEQTRKMISSTTTDGYTGCIAAFRNLDLFGDLGRINVPTLFMVGENDPASTPEIMRGMHERVPGSQFRVIQDAAHLPSLEQPAAVTATMLEFLCSVQSTCAPG